MAAASKDEEPGESEFDKTIRQIKVKAGVAAFTALTGVIGVAKAVPVATDVAAKVIKTGTDVAAKAVKSGANVVKDKAVTARGNLLKK